MKKPSAPQASPSSSARRSPRRVDDRPDARALHHHGADADQGQRQADGRRIPAIAVGRIEHEGGGQHHMRDLPEEIRQRQAGENPVRAQQMQRAERVGAFPAERCAAFRRQRLREDQPAVKRIRKAQACRDPERQARIHAAEQAADGGTENEPGAEGRADLAEHRSTPFRRRHVGDIGKRGRDARRGNA